MLENKIVFITGATAGIGAACASAFAEAGARLILAARSQERLSSIAETLRERYQVEVLAITLDVRDRQAVALAIQALPDAWQSIDILVNNAGLALGLDTIQEGDLDDWDAMIDTNVKGLLYVSHHIMKGMVARHKGHVVNIGSISGYSVYAKGAVYCATKFAVRAISEGMKMDVHGTPIRITEIDPGMVDTEFSHVRFKGDASRAAAAYDGFEPLHADDIAASVLYAVMAPPHVDVRQMTIMPTAQTAPHLLHKEK